MTDNERSIELEVEVDGTPEEVWRAIATGPGIGSWYVPHTVEERAGGAATARFGDGEGMQVDGRVAAWEPPNRIVFDGGEGAGGLAFEWLVEAVDGGTCIVRLVNSGFGRGGEWDDQYDAMTEGWGLFLRNLQLHLAHFKGRTATTMLPTAYWPGPPDEAWRILATGVGFDAAAGGATGERASLGGGALPRLAGTVVETGPHRLTILVDDPAPGTAFVAAEGMGDTVQVSVWAYLYGPEGTAAVERDGPRWQAWLDGAATPPSP
jgi:uncharacterized protein YndB with AHSA1/START domain